jgi:hypothetical protein
MPNMKGNQAPENFRGCGYAGFFARVKDITVTCDPAVFPECTR